MEPIQMQQVTSRQDEPRWGESPQNGSLVVGLVLLALFALVIAVCVLAPSASAAGGCGGG